MGEAADGTFVMADNERDGNPAFPERERYSHDGRAASICTTPDCPHAKIKITSPAAGTAPTIQILQNLGPGLNEGQILCAGDEPNFAVPDL